MRASELEELHLRRCCQILCINLAVLALRPPGVASEGCRPTAQCLS